MEKISGIYKITNTITDEFYIGSSKNIKHRWVKHKCPSTWKNCPNNTLYIDMQKYGLNNFTFEILEETDNLKEREQYWINLLQPTYNNRRANGRDTERYKEWYKVHRDEKLTRNKEWSETHKKEIRTYQKEYRNRACIYNGEKLTFYALSQRFYRAGIPHPTQEARKYLVEA